MFLTKQFHYHAGIKVRVYCQVGKAYQGKFALHVAVKTLGLYKEYVLIYLQADISLAVVNSDPVTCFYMLTDMMSSIILIKVNLML